MLSTGKERPPRGSPRGERLVSSYSLVFDLSYQFLPASLVLSFPPDLPHFSLFLSLVDCITLCRRQAVWPVYSSVASSPLSPSPSVPLPLSILIPFLAVFILLSRTFTVAALPTDTFRTCPSRVCDTCPVCVCDTFLGSDRLLRQPVL